LSLCSNEHLVGQFRVRLNRCLCHGTVVREVKLPTVEDIPD
jgi:hypothetical protein